MIICGVCLVLLQLSCLLHHVVHGRTDLYTVYSLELCELHERSLYRNKSKLPFSGGNSKVRLCFSVTPAWCTTRQVSWHLHLHERISVLGDPIYTFTLVAVDSM